MQAVTITRSDYRDDLEALLERSKGPAWLREGRERAFARFEERGFPTTRDEGWKYTDLRPIAARKLPLATAETGVPHLVESRASGPRAVVVNGRFRADLSNLHELPTGVRVRSLAEAVDADEPRLEESLFEIGGEERALALLHLALFEDGVWIDVDRGREAKVIVRLHVEGATEKVMVSPRILVTAGESARVQVLVETTGRGSYFANALTQVRAEANSHVQPLIREDDSVDAYHYHLIATTQKRDSRLEVHAVTLGAQLSRTEYANVLGEEGSDCRLHGLYVPRGKQHMDHHVALEHAVGHTTSAQKFKGVLDDDSRGVFTGCVLVREGADGTNAQQVNRNLLLSETAKAETRPQLEIYADDVKCSHGAAIGQLDENQLFYARARGIDRDSARAILTYAFANEVLESWPDEATREELEALLAERWGSSVS